MRFFLQSCTAGVLLVFFSTISSAQDLVGQISGVDCSNISSVLGDSSKKDSIDKAARIISKTSVLRYLTGADSYFESYYTQLEQRSFVSGFRFSNKIKLLRDKVVSDEQRQYLDELRKSFEDQQKEAFGEFWSKNSKERKYAKLASDCAMKALAEDSDSNAVFQLVKLVDKSRGITRKARVGYFDVSVDACKVQSLPITGNKYTEPDNWEGSRFIVLDVTFKNNDSEGRLPQSGELLVDFNGRELVYDTTEAIMQRGFGIYFQSVNPLLSMKTKLVYRIPNEISGEVFWMPGRNEGKKKLWCAFVKAADS